MQSISEINKLLTEHKKLIESEAKKYATNVPLITMQIEAHRLARFAAESYSPNMGKFSTHLVNSLKKLSRLSTQYGSTVRLPENTQFAINKINNIEKQLDSEFGRAPTVEELSDYSGMNIKTVNNLLKNKKSIISFNNMLNTPTIMDSSNDEWVAFVYHDLTPKDKLIFEHMTGFGGKEKISSKNIAKKLKISEIQLNQRIKLISDKLNEGWK
jgi:DNA-directed RNA polymerase sigma subunit (sigma70/sigma32)